MWDSLNLPKLILASRSPRRAFLLRQVGLEFEVIEPYEVKESNTGCDFAQLVLVNALRKAESVRDRAEGKLVLGVDTLVDFTGIPLGKPKDREEARWMLTRLSGQMHQVWSGIALCDFARPQVLTAIETTKVWFRPLLPEEIEAYIASGEPIDKAGGYGIQGLGAVFISRVEGCFFNVMGLPLTRLWELILHWKRQNP